MLHDKSEAWNECNMKKSAIQKLCYLKRVQHEMSAARKNCNMKRW